MSFQVRFFLGNLIVFTRYDLKLDDYRTKAPNEIIIDKCPIQNTSKLQIIQSEGIFQTLELYTKGFSASIFP